MLWLRMTAKARSAFAYATLGTMNWALVKKLAAAAVTLGGFNFLTRPGGMQETVIGLALVAAGALLFYWSTRG